MMLFLSSFRLRQVGLLTGAVMAGLCLVPATADAATLDDIVQNVLEQLTVAPPLFKQISLVAGMFMAMGGIYALYKGLGDTRNPTPWKTLWLILIGSCLAAIGGLALKSEATVFGTNDDRPGVTWSNTTSKLKVFNR